jgi:DNA-binding transcriptional LysR family regulator
MSRTYTDELPDTVAMVPLGREVLYAVLPRQHRLAGLRRVTLKQIAREPLVSLPTDARTRRLIDAAASRQGITLQRAVTANQVATVMSLVRAGLGVAILPAGATTGFNTEGLGTVPIAGPTLSLHLGLVTLKERELTPAALGIATLIRSVWSTTQD